MPSTRNYSSPGIFAADAQTSVPTTPIAGVSYRDAANGTATVRQGWPFADKVDSAEFNEIMFRLTSIADGVDRMGVLGWSIGVNYAVPAVVFGSDNQMYFSTAQSGPATAPQDPVTARAYWRSLSSVVTGSLVGMMATLPTNAVGPGWLERNGALLPIADYPELFAVIGNVYDTSAPAGTFRLMDDRGMFIRMLDNGAGHDSGRLFGSFQPWALAFHTHTFTTSTNGAHQHDLRSDDQVGAQGGSNVANFLATGDGGVSVGFSATAGSHAHNGSTDQAGNNVENRVSNKAYIAVIRAY